MTTLIIAMTIFGFTLSLLFISILFKIKSHHRASNAFQQELNNQLQQNTVRDEERYKHLHDRLEKLIQLMNQNRQEFDKHQIQGFKLLQDTLTQGMTQTTKQLTTNLSLHIENLVKQMEALTHTTNERLKEISGQVEKRLTEGFEKTTAIFADVTKRLALIDMAQKKITELSGNVVSLQEVLADKRSRGVFGEVQLASLLRNVMPENHFSLQYTLSNNKRVDCMLFLPEPTGNIAIDAKFPLESYHLLTDISISENERQTAKQTFRRDIQKHIKDISEKYIIPNETADGAVMFIPAEAVFAEIHAHFPELVEKAYRAKVWMVSPTTMMAVLTTARAVLKDDATRKQVHIIKEHLNYLSKDFDRFESRMGQLAKHIEQAHEDVQKVNTSAKKLTSRFAKIERVELEERVELDEHVTDESLAGELETLEE